MAIKALMLKKKIDRANSNLAPILEKAKELELRESELQKALEEAETEEEINAVEEEVNALEADKENNKKAKDELTQEIDGYKEELAKLEEEINAEPEAPTQGEPAEDAKPEERKVNVTMNKRNLFANMPILERDAMFNREDVKGWLGEFRSAVKEKRALNNIGLTIPDVLIGYLRQNIENYSKLYKYVNVRSVSGNAREVVEGAIPEAVWTECCANLNELSLTWNDVEVGCFKVAGFFKVCNATLEDSDIALASELLTAIGQAIGLALDKAILYGRNTASNYKMPLGVVSRLAQTSQPSDYPTTARPWADLHTSHMLTIANTVTGVDLFKTILLDSVVVDGKYARGEKVWVMNETTRVFLMAQGMNVNAAGQIVVAIDGRMPVVGGIIEVLDFIPNYVIIGGYFELYLLAERAGKQFAQSEHAFFLQDATAFKGSARYDGTPVIAESFIALGINGTTPTADMTFAADNANTVSNIVLNKNAATVTAAAGTNHTVQLKATLLPDGVKDTITWASSDSTKATVSTNGLVTGVATGSAVITATSGDATAVCNVTVSGS